MSRQLHELPDGWLDKVWNRLQPVEDECDCGEPECAICAVDDVCDMFNELDPERFPLIVDGELVEN